MSKALGRVLIIAGSDSGGGAGLQADLKAVTALGGFAATAVTALTVQKEDGTVAFIPVLYLFRKPPETMWQIEDMQLGQVSLRTHMAKILPEKISAKGFAGILRDLSAIAEGHRKPGDYFPL